MKGGQRKRERERESFGVNVGDEWVTERLGQWEGGEGERRNGRGGIVSEL